MKKEQHPPKSNAVEPRTPAINDADIHDNEIMSSFIGVTDNTITSQHLIAGVTIR